MVSDTTTRAALTWRQWRDHPVTVYWRQWRDHPGDMTTRASLTWRQSRDHPVTVISRLPGTSLVTVQWWKHEFLMKLCKNPEISPLILESIMHHHCFSAFWQWFPIIWCRFQVHLTQNRRAFIGRTKSQKCLVKLIVWFHVFAPTSGYSIAGISAQGGQISVL